MAVIVIHAGMGKAGSSSVLRWLRDNSPALREGGFSVVTAPFSETGDIVFAPYDRGVLSSGWIARSLLANEGGAQPRADALAEALDGAADRYGDLVVTGESLASLFYNLHAPSLTALEWLAAQHEVRVAYYVRPQHTSLEARWRQAGFRSGKRPSVHIERRAAFLHYASTRRGVRSRAPSIDFEPRPFRQDLLDCGHVVADFAGRFLGVEATEKPWVNRGLPLEVVNILHAAPAGMFWDRSYGNRRVKRIKQLLDGHSVPEDGRIALSRQVLRKYAYERYAVENAELGWDDFVPPPEDPEGTPGLEALDELWKPQASPAELSLLFRALDAAIEE